MTTTNLVATIIDLLAMSLVLGATVWFFLIQSPALFKSIGRERFVPLQMRLAILFFKTATAMLVVMLAASVVRTGALVGWPTITAAVALAAVLINKIFVLPRALRAGGHSRRHDDFEGKATATTFVSLGAGQSAKTLHRLVVAFVVFMLAGVLVHGLALITSGALA